VGQAGHVVSLDINPLHVDMARDMVRAKHLDNVDILQGDARRTGLPAVSFDLFSARLLLVNIPDPEEAVAEMTGLVKAGS
jgi:ubiquinone/menaquinone biosynthesis C-methylase UbiE